MMSTQSLYYADRSQTPNPASGGEMSVSPFRQIATQLLSHGYKRFMRELYDGRLLRRSLDRV